MTNYWRPRKSHSTLSDLEKAASSKAINKTITEIEALLVGQALQPAKGLRAKLHTKLDELRRSEAKQWYRRGFRRGHETSAGFSKKVPKTITRKMRMKSLYFGQGGESILLKSKI